MEELVDRGMVRHIGVSNFLRADLQEAQRAMTRYPIVSNQVLYSLKDRNIEAELLPYCREHGVTVIAYTPLADGSLAVKPRLRPDRRFRELEQVAREAGKTPAQVALNWVTSRDGVITIPKTNSVARTEENCAASGWRSPPRSTSAGWRRRIQPDLSAQNTSVRLWGMEPSAPWRPISRQG